MQNNDSSTKNYCNKTVLLYRMEEWKKDLQRCGTYYEGWVDDADNLLSVHEKTTVTSYGTRRSTKTLSHAACNKENECPDNKA